MKKLVVLFAALALFAAACGGGGDDDDSSAFGESESSSSDESSSSGDTLSTSEWCDINTRVDSLGVVGPGAVFAEDGMSGFLDIIDEVEDRAPDEIKDDIAVIGEFMSDFNDMLAEVDYDFLALTPAQLETLEDPAVEAASDNISAYADDNCGTSSDDSSDDPVDEPEADDSSSDDDTAPDIDPNDSIGQVFVDTFMQIGMTEDQANCIVDELDLATFSAESFNPFEFLDLFDKCGVDPTQLQ
jgi:hypothetical protein